MTTASRRLRPVSVGLSVIAAAGLLAACSKPQPTVTVLNGSDATIVKAQPACVLLTTPCATDQGKVASIKALAGSEILVDVPKDLANSGWIVAAYTTDATGKNVPITGAGSPTIKGSHSVRVTVPRPTTDSASGSYQLQVSALKPNNQRTTWLVVVNLKA